MMFIDIILGIILLIFVLFIMDFLLKNCLVLGLSISSDRFHLSMSCHRRNIFTCNLLRILSSMFCPILLGKHQNLSDLQLSI